MKRRRREREREGREGERERKERHTEVDGLLERGLGEQARGVADTAGGGDDLSSTTVNSIGVKLSNTRASLAHPPHYTTRKKHSQ